MNILLYDFRIMMPIIYILIIIAGISFCYKIYLQIKIQNLEGRMPTLTFWCTLGLMIFVPIYWNFKNDTAKILAKRANKSLFLFYTIFIVIMILSNFLGKN
jgi:hypothetical protein